MIVEYYSFVKTEDCCNEGDSVSISTVMVKYEKYKKGVMRCKLI
jgi:hypothetical protein